MKIQQNFANVAKFAKFAIFQKLPLDNLVDFKKCCKTRIFLQKSVPIQPKTSNILPKFCRSAVVSPTDVVPGALGEFREARRVLNDLGELNTRAGAAHLSRIAAALMEAGYVFSIYIHFFLTSG